MLKSLGCLSCRESSTVPINPMHIPLKRNNPADSSTSVKVFPKSTVPKVLCAGQRYI